MPEGWAWCRLKQLSLDMADGPFGSNLKAEHYTKNKEARIIQLSNIGEYGWREENTKYTTLEHAKNNISRSIVEPGNVVIAKMMPAGRAIICPNNEKMYVLSSDAVKLVPTSLINSNYLLNAINSPFFRASVTDNVQGTTRLRTSISKLRDCFFPVPPLNEQVLIVNAIENAISQIDILEQNKIDLQNLITQAKSKILDLAIHGKLVPQDPNDEPAEELLKRIATSDNRPYEKVDESEELFETPTSWCWSKLKNICSDFIVPQRDKPKVFDGNIPWCRIEDIEGKYLNGSLSNQLVSKETIKQMNMHICPVGSVICSCSASLGIQAITTVECCTNQTFIGIVPVNSVLYNEYLFYYLKAQTKYFHEIATGTTIKYISRDKFEELPFALPPFEEQKRIVSKIEELYSKLDEIVLNLV